MPKAEVGSTKHIANRMKAKGLQRLRWYCQICAKQCRDENGFKQHTQSEGHVRAMLLVGDSSRSVIADYSRQFQQDFLQLLKSSRNEKKVGLNQFYQEYIRDKEHVHMNATKWPSLTEFARHLGREGLVRVEEGEGGRLEIAWVDDSADAVRRREEVRRRDRLVRGEEEVEGRLMEAQIQRARKEALRREREGMVGGEVREEAGKEGEVAEGKDAIQQIEPIKVSLSLKGKGIGKSESSAVAADAPVAIETLSSADKTADTTQEAEPQDDGDEDNIEALAAPAPPAAPQPKVLISLSAKAKTSNPLAAKSNPFAKKKAATSSSSTAPSVEKKMSNTERIMMEELERKRLASERGHGGNSFKRARIG